MDGIGIEMREREKNVPLLYASSLLLPREKKILRRASGRPSVEVGKGRVSARQGRVCQTRPLRRLHNRTESIRPNLSPATMDLKKKTGRLDGRVGIGDLCL